MFIKSAKKISPSFGNVAKNRFPSNNSITIYLSNPISWENYFMRCWFVRKYNFYEYTTNSPKHKEELKRQKEKVTNCSYSVLNLSLIVHTKSHVLLESTKISSSAFFMESHHFTPFKWVSSSTRTSWRLPFSKCFLGKLCPGYFCLSSGTSAWLLIKSHRQKRL